MTFVNSKLSELDKANRKIWLYDIKELGGRVMSFPKYRVTVAFMPEFPGSRMMLVTISYAESREVKFKRKVGEFYALNRMFCSCEFIKVPSVFNIEDMGMYNDEELDEYQAEWAENFASGLVL